MCLVRSLARRVVLRKVWPYQDLVRQYSISPELKKYASPDAIACSLMQLPVP